MRRLLALLMVTSAGLSAEVEGPAPALPGTTAAEVEKAVEASGATVKVAERPRWPRAKTTSIEIRLSPQGETSGVEVVSFAVPFPPDTLTDDKALRVTSGSEELAAFTKPLVHWWIDGRKGAIRSVLVQFEMEFEKGKARSVTLSWQKPRTKSRDAAVSVADTREKVAASGYTFHRPKVLALLPPEWMCDSLVMWQQVTAKENTGQKWFDEHLVEKFDASTANIATRRYEAHLFDRPATYAKIYCRHGGEKYLLAAMKAGDFYIQNISPEGYFKLKKGDHKYVYTEGSAVLYMLTGDPRYTEVIGRMMKWWERHRAIVYKGRGFWTERHHGFGMAANVHAYEITGDPKYIEKAKLFFEAALSLQAAPLDKKPPDGAWLHTSSSHGDGNGWTTSPWMSCFLTDAVWKYWMLTGDARAASSLAMYSRFTEKHSVSADGRGVRYMANSPGRGRPGHVVMPEHNFEGCYLLAMGYWLSGGADEVFTKKIATLWPPTMKDGANRPGRKFNWRFRETSMLIWFLKYAGKAPEPEPVAAAATAAGEKGEGAPAGVDRAAATAAEAKLRKEIIEGVKGGRKARVYVDLAGRPARARVVAADEAGIEVKTSAMQVTVKWSKLSPTRFYGVARRYSKDHAALAAYCRGNGLTEEAEREEARVK